TPRRSPTTRIRTGASGRPARRWWARDGRAGGIGGTDPDAGGPPRGSHLPASAGGAARAARRAVADPVLPRRRDQPEHTDLLHEPQSRQRALADRGDRGAGARSAA